MEQNSDNFVQANPKPKLLRGTLMMLFQSMVGAYGLSVIAFLLLHFSVGESWRLVAFFNVFAHLLWLPSLLLLPLSLLLRAWLPALLLVPAVLAFGLTYGQQFLPRNPDPSQGPTLTLLTYNLLAGRGSYDESIAIIRAADAEIVLLQEVGFPIAAQIEAQLSDLYPYMALHPQAEQTAGQGILSRYPIEADTYWRYDWLRFALGHQRAEFTLNGQTITLYNLHPTHPAMSGSFFDPRNRELEIAALLAEMAEIETPIILGGDFNLTELSDDYAAITARYRDAYRDAGWGLGWTFPRWGLPVPPFLRIDYVFSSPAIRALEARVIDAYGSSDHHPLLVRLLLPGPA